MLIVVNGQMHSLAEPHTLAALLLSVAPTPPFAVARNNEFISSRAYEECLPAGGDKIDIVHPTVGVDMEKREMADQLTLYGQTFSSRLLLG